MKIFGIVSIILLLSFQSLNAQSYKQKQNSIWLGSGCYECVPYQGLSGVGLDFNSDTVKTIRGASWRTDSLYNPSGYHYGFGYNDNDGSATISDANGNLLFYTDGNIVYDRNHKVMLNGRDINNTGQLPANLHFVTPMGMPSGNNNGVVIVPKPGSRHEYYIFCVPGILKDYYDWVYNDIYNYYSYVFLGYYHDWYGKLYCSVVDMELNNGLGSVKDKGIFMQDSMAGILHGVSGDNCDLWLLGYGGSGEYKAFNISSLGVATAPVISKLNTISRPFSYAVEINVSPNRRKVALAMYDYAELSDFNPSTGVISNGVSLGVQTCVSIAFSPNDSLLYLSGYKGLYQYQTYYPMRPTHVLSDTAQNYYWSGSPLRLAMNEKIYFGEYGRANYPMCIQHPNLLGIACNIDTIGPRWVRGGKIPLDHPFPLLVRSTGWFNFPNEVPLITYDTVYTTQNAYLCLEEPILLEPQIVEGTDFQWMVNTVADTQGGFKKLDGAKTAKLWATVSGTYVVQYFTTNPCLIHCDTFHVVKTDFALYLDKDSISCDGQAIELNVSIAGAECVWQDNSTSDHYLAKQSGVYWVQITKDGCSITDSVNILILDIQQNLGKDTTLCLEDKAGLPLLAYAPDGSTVLWSTGSNTRSIQARDSGLYWVRVNYETCVSTDSISIGKQYCDCPYLMPTAFSPNKDGQNDVYRPSLSGACPVSDYLLQIYNRWGQLVFLSDQWAKGWDGNVGGLPADIGNYYYHLRMTTGLRPTEIMKTGEFVLMR